MDVKHITYDSTWRPAEGRYLVTIGKKGVGTVYLITQVRQVNRKKPQPDGEIRWALTVQADPEMKAFTEYSEEDGYLQVWVRGEYAYPCVWYSRDKKKP